MLTYEFRSRFIHFLSKTKPILPADVTISVALQPLPQFGGEKGETRNASRTAKMKVRVSPSTGRFIFELDEPLFPYLNAKSEAVGTDIFSIKGHVVSVESRVQSFDDVGNLLVALYYVFPAILNLDLPDSPHALYAWGIIGGDKFQWHYDTGALNGDVIVSSKENQEQYALKSWEMVIQVRQSARMFMSLQYFRIACRLLISGQNRFEFMAEAVLNLAKCLQSLCGESRDKVREVLGDLGVSSREAETLYLPALFLRDSFNVAHISLSQYNSDQLRTLHEYVDIAEGHFRRLLKTALQRFESGEFTPGPSTSGGNQAREAKFIEKLDENLRSFRDFA